jgi:hypothetical protein
LRDTYTTLKSRGVLVDYIKISLDWSACDSVSVQNGGLTELPLVTVHQSANEDMCFEGESEGGDFQIVEDLLMNRNVTNAHLINNSNGYLLNDDIFDKKKPEY